MKIKLTREGFEIIYPAERDELAGRLSSRRAIEATRKGVENRNRAWGKLDVFSVGDVAMAVQRGRSPIFAVASLMIE